MFREIRGRSVYLSVIPFLSQFLLHWFSDTKAEGTTSLLLEAAALAVKGDKNFGICFDKVGQQYRNPNGVAPKLGSFSFVLCCSFM